MIVSVKGNHNHDSKIQMFIRYLWCLTLVPRDQGVLAWDNFVKLNVQEVDEDNFEDENQKAEAALRKLGVL